VQAASRKKTLALYDVNKFCIGQAVSVS